MTTLEEILAPVRALPRDEKQMAVDLLTRDLAEEAMIEQLRAAAAVPYFKPELRPEDLQMVYEMAMALREPS